MSRTDERMAMLEGELDNLRHRVAQLEAENKELKDRVARIKPQDPLNPWTPIDPKPGALPNPWTPKSSPQHPDYVPPQIDPSAPLPTPPTPWFAKETTCSKCGIVWKGAMGYVCPDGLCPMGKNSILC